MRPLVYNINDSMYFSGLCQSPMTLLSCGGCKASTDGPAKSAESRPACEFRLSERIFGRGRVHTVLSGVGGIVARPLRRLCTRRSALGSRHAFPARSFIMRVSLEIVRRYFLETSLDSGRRSVEISPRRARLPSHPPRRLVERRHYLVD